MEWNIFADETEILYPITNKSVTLWHPPSIISQSMKCRQLFVPGVEFGNSLETSVNLRNYILMDPRVGLQKLMRLSPKPVDLLSGSPNR